MRPTFSCRAAGSIAAGIYASCIRHCWRRVGWGWSGEEVRLDTLRFVGDEMTRTLNRLRGLLSFPPRPAVAETVAAPGLALVAAQA